MVKQILDLVYLSAGALVIITAGLSANVIRRISVGAAVATLFALRRPLRHTDFSRGGVFVEWVIYVAFASTPIIRRLLRATSSIG